MVNKSKKGKLKNLLNKEYRFDDGIRSLEEEINRREINKITVFVRFYSKRKIKLEYKKLKNPKKEYTIWDNNDLGIGISKIVAEYYANKINQDIIPFNKSTRKYLEDSNYRPY